MRTEWMALTHPIQSNTVYLTDQKSFQGPVGQHRRTAQHSFQLSILQVLNRENTNLEISCKFHALKFQLINPTYWRNHSNQSWIWAFWQPLKGYRQPCRDTSSSMTFRLHLHSIPFSWPPGWQWKGTCWVRLVFLDTSAAVQQSWGTVWISGCTCIPLILMCDKRGVASTSKLCALPQPSKERHKGKSLPLYCSSLRTCAEPRLQWGVRLKGSCIIP